MNRLEHLIEESSSIIEQAMIGCSKPLIAFSGGKDAIVLADILRKRGITTSICEISFCFEQQIQSIREMGSYLGLSVTYSNRPSSEWLLAHPEIIFTNAREDRNYSFQIRQRKTISRHAKLIGADVVFYGRRYDENSVRSPIYQADYFKCCHPLAEWKTTDIWNYFAVNEIPIPFIYTVRFGQIEGNAPFYSLRPKDVGSISDCWDVVNEIDTQREFERRYRR